ncbi:MAG: DUF3267 domain-containing protein [Prevotellaceae bacterium]|jgi:hypothetical protein|nr:DUF3267 domain-containing protein [Prevotellaceae bacterium]
MSEPKYTKEYSIKLKVIYSYMLLLYIPAAVITILFKNIWRINTLSLNILSLNERILFLLLIIVGVIIHELIHGIFAAIFSSNRFKNIKFGFSIRSFVAYCNINEIMKVKYFKVIAIMPFIILGILPIIISLFFGCKTLFDFGILLSIGSIGDLIMFNWLCKEKNNYWVKESDNAKKLEIVVFEK